LGAFFFLWIVVVFFPLPHGVLKRNLILLSEIPQTHTYYTG